MKSVFIVVALVTLGILIATYTAFVLQNLWNWFIAGAIHGVELSFWQAGGILLVVMLIRHEPSKEDTAEKDKERWTRLLAMMKEAVPEHRRIYLEEPPKEQKNSWKDIAKTASGPLLEKVGLNTSMLIIGWLIHSFLM